MPSSVIHHINYDKDTGTLKVTFLSGAVYLYYGVPDEMYLRFTRARSKGTFLNLFIKDHYEFERIEPQ